MSWTMRGKSRLVSVENSVQRNVCMCVDVDERQGERGESRNSRDDLGIQTDVEEWCSCGTGA